MPPGCAEGHSPRRHPTALLLKEKPPEENNTIPLAGAGGWGLGS